MHFFHTWAGPALHDVIVLTDLDQASDFVNTIIFCAPREANAKLELIKSLAHKGCYFVFVQPAESDTQTMRDLLDDAPEFRQSPWILGGENPSVWHLNLESFFFLTLSDTNRLMSLAYTTPQYLAQGQKPFRFRYLNGHDRPHRNQLWKTLEATGVLDHALCSYLGYSHNGETPCDIALRVLPDRYESPHRQKGSITQLRQDRYRFAFIQHYWTTYAAYMQIYPNQFIDTYFTLEAEMSTTHFFPTEKTYKPILAGHPFIILSHAGYLARLRDQGFRTFDGVIDESYDLEPDLDLRIQMIAREVHRLCDEDLETFLLNVRDICIHNQQHYIAQHWPKFQHTHEKLVQFLQDIQQRAETYQGNLS